VPKIKLSVSTLSTRNTGTLPGAPISNPGPNVVKGFLTVQQHHFDHGADNDSDPAGWNRASYTPDILTELGEPLPDPVNGYRQAALHYLGIIYSIDEFITAAPDARVAVVAVAVVLGWPSARGLSVQENGWTHV
jgi:hypothetical protein